MADIEKLSISFPDFVLDTIIDPEQFDQNNAEIVGKINEIIDKVNSEQIDFDAHKDEMAQLAKYRINANQSIPNATDTILAIDYKDTQLNDNFSELVGNDLKILKVGIYEIKVAVLWASNTVGFRQVNLLQNSEINTRISQNAVSGSYTTQNLSTIINADVGMLLNVQVYQNSGSAINVMNDTRQCYIMIKKVG